MRRSLIALALASAVPLAGAGVLAPTTAAQRPTTPSMCGLVSTAPTYKHVIFIFEENSSYNSIYQSSSAPYINSVINSCGLATNYHNITHPSLPNYIATTDGAPPASLAPFLSDCVPSTSCESSSNNIFHEAAAKTGSWKSYAESMRSNCSKTNAGFYAPRHNPAVYYTDLAASCSNRDVPFRTSAGYPILKDFSSETTAPAFAFVTPNLCDDMHGATGCPSNSILTGDNWLKTWLPQIAGTTVFKNLDTAIFVVWDEGEPGTKGESCATNTTDQSCHVVMMVIAPSVKPGTQVSIQLNHYSLLKAAEDLLKVAELGSSQTATSMLAAFNL